jgi:hypothetical protein
MGTPLARPTRTGRPASSLAVAVVAGLLVASRPPTARAAAMTRPQDPVQRLEQQQVRRFEQHVGGLLHRLQADQEHALRVVHHQQVLLEQEQARINRHLQQEAAHLLRQQQADAALARRVQAAALQRQQARFAQLVEDRHTYLKDHPLSPPITPTALQILAFDVRHPHPSPFLDFLIARRAADPARFDRVFPRLGPLLGVESELLQSQSIPQAVAAISSLQLAAAPALVPRAAGPASATRSPRAVEAEMLLPPDPTPVPEPSAMSIGLALIASVALARRLAGPRRGG